MYLLTLFRFTIEYARVLYVPANQNDPLYQNRTEQMIYSWTTIFRNQSRILNEPFFLQ